MQRIMAEVRKITRNIKYYYITVKNFIITKNNTQRVIHKNMLRISRTHILLKDVTFYKDNNNMMAL